MPRRALTAPAVLGLISILVALVARHSPFMQAAPAPSGAQPWADGPMRLVATPQHATNKTDLFTVGATHMALLHNAVVRGYNSIVLQAAHVRPADRADFAGYCRTWLRFVTSHHDDEEENLFARIEELLDDSSVFAETHKEHDSFMPGLAELDTYLTSLAAPSAALDGDELLRIMKAFHAPFEAHFHSEIGTLAALAAHPNAPAPDSPRAAAAADAFRRWGKTTVTKAGTTDVVPFFLLNLDRTAGFEDGVWAAWPPIPAPVKWGLINVGGWFKSGYWKFASCDSQGNRRELYALADAMPSA